MTEPHQELVQATAADAFGRLATRPDEWIALHQTSAAIDVRRHFYASHQIPKMVRLTWRQIQMEAYWMTVFERATGEDSRRGGPYREEKRLCSSTSDSNREGPQPWRLTVESVAQVRPLSGRYV